MAAALTLLAKQRGDVTFVHQSLYYPVTDAAQDTESYREFAGGPFLTARSMAWFWDAYLPERDQRTALTVSPLRATLDDLADLPEAFVIVDENDVLRDEGEAYARQLTAAGVRTTSVRFNGICHDFMMLNPLRGTAATTAAVAIMAKQRGDVTFCHQSMYYPVTDAAQDTDSYIEFFEGPFLLAKSMAWFWDAYLPDESRRGEITASPLRATLDDLKGLPEAFVAVDENDVLRDEGEAYARRLIEAGVRTTTVRYNATIHDFMMLNPLRSSAASTGAIEQAISVLRKAFRTS